MPDALTRPTLADTIATLRQRALAYPLAEVPQQVALDAADALETLAAYAECQTAYLAWFQNETIATAATAKAVFARHGFDRAGMTYTRWFEALRLRALDLVRGTAEGGWGVNTLRLRNGANEAEPLVVTTGLVLRALFAAQTTVFFEAVEIARDHYHQPWGNTGDVLRRHALIDAAGRMHESVRNIVLSSVEGEGLDMRLVNPVAPDEPTELPRIVHHSDSPLAPIRRTS